MAAAERWGLDGAPGCSWPALSLLLDGGEKTLLWNPGLVGVGDAASSRTQ